jgi:uncharacterized RDD family membrane protein YckC
MYCSKCGTKLTADTVFCSACGQPTGFAAVGAASSTPAIGAGETSYASPAVVVPGSVARYTPTGAMLVVPSPYAGFWLRFLAYIIDHVLLGVIVGVVAVLAIAAIGVGYFQAMVQGIHDGDGAFPFELVSTILFAVLVMFFVSWIYHAWMESSQYQGTLGKMALGLVVTDMNDQRITFGRASGRFFARIVSSLIPLELGYIMAGITEKKQALHDMIASCLVLRKI